jgi:hypothetical protein
MGTKPESTAATPPPEPLKPMGIPAEKVGVRAPVKAGDSVHYRPFGATAEADPWHAVVAKTFGSRVNLAALSGTGTWLSLGPVDYDESGRLEGHWSWPK